MSSYHYQNSPYNNNYSHEAPPLPLHLCFFLLTLICFIFFSWYMSYESFLETVAYQARLILMLSPLVLLLAVHLMSTNERQHISFFIPLPERDSLHRAGGSPWGVGLVLVLLLLMVSYQSYFQERWFPLLSR
ncbi:hypothetical protein LUZ63_007210 [Rhynchospora breviuscula]|uniref:Uncharacterized protein n=1 Tax=Rhynchospora breviuscula TaxID=2022672 RepID=A0A9Q0HUV0_9POAL|nr:hypothetical protein LUZ63_007210 [Rhynchospora breviuscula]